MTDDEDISPKQGIETITVGEDLGPFSIDELNIRITDLINEIERVKSEIKCKEAQASMADNLFK